MNMNNDIIVIVSNTCKHVTYTIPFHFCLLKNILTFQFWSLNEEHELKIDSLLCLEVTRHSDVPKVMKCHGQGEAQEWRYNKVQYFSSTLGALVKSGNYLGHRSHKNDMMVILGTCLLAIDQQVPTKEDTHDSGGSRLCSQVGPENVLAERALN